MITLPVSALKPHLPGFAKIVPKHGMAPLRCLRFEGQAAGLVQITASNLTDTVTLNLEVTSSTPGFVALIPLEQLTDILKRASAKETVTIQQQDSGLVVSCTLHNTALHRPVEPVVVGTFPTTPVVDGTAITVGDDFKGSLMRAFDCTSEDPNRATLAHAYIDVTEPKSHYVVGSNGHVLYAGNSLNLALKESFMVARRKFLLWPEFVADGDWQISLGEAGFLKIASKRWTYIARQMEGAYPLWRQAMPKAEGAQIQFDEASIKLALEVLPRLPGHQGNAYVRLVALENGSVVLQSTEDDTTVPLPGANGTACSIRCDRRYLMKGFEMGCHQISFPKGGNAFLMQNKTTRLAVALGREQDQPQTVNPEPSTQPETKQEPMQQPQTTVQPTEPVNAFLQLRTHLEKVKEQTKSLLGDLNESLRLASQVQKEKRASDKEVEEVREALQSLQRIRI